MHTKRSTHKEVVHLQTALEKAKQSAIEKAANRPGKNLLLTEIDTAFRKLKRNKEAWKQELDERREWEI